MQNPRFNYNFVKDYFRHHSSQINRILTRMVYVITILALVLGNAGFTRMDSALASKPGDQAQESLPSEPAPSQGAYPAPGEEYPPQNPGEVSDQDTTIATTLEISPELPANVQLPLPGSFPPTITLTASPATIVHADKVKLSYSLLGLPSDLSGYSLAITAPPNTIPVDDFGTAFDPTTGILALPLTDRSGSIQWNLPPESDNLDEGPDQATNYSFPVSLLLNQQIQASNELVLQARPPKYVTVTGGEAEGLNGNVKVKFPYQAAGEDLAVVIREVSLENMPPRAAAKHMFEITAQGKHSKTKVRHFNHPIEIQVAYDGQEFAGREDYLRIFYFDENLHTWMPMSTHVDRENHLLTTISDHLTAFKYDSQNWQAARLPSIDAFQVSQFTGAGTYSFPFWAPPGPGGLQMTASLSYNSQIVDRASVQTQASEVGMGWTLDAGGYIERDQHGTDVENDDLFSIQAGGVSSSLVWDGTSYQTTDHSFWKIQRFNNASQDYWVAWDTVGNTYYFSTTVQIPAFNKTGFSAPCDWEFEEPLTWRWGLTRIKNSFGQSIYFTYDKDTIQVHREGCFHEETFTKDIAVYPASVYYEDSEHNSHYSIAFIYDNDRLDYDTAWADTLSFVQYRYRLLKQVLVKNNTTIIRSYDLAYNPYAGENPTAEIFPNLIWPAGGKTPVLKSIAESGGALSLPATSFTYDDGLHLKTITNGYGATSLIDYGTTPWYEVTNLESQALNLDGKCRDSVPPDGWRGEIDCARHGEYNEFLFIGKRGDYLVENSSLILPGGAYRIQLQVSNDGERAVEVTFGLSYSSNDKDLVNSLGPVVLPADSNIYTLDGVVILNPLADQASLFVSCDGCLVHNALLTRLTSIYPAKIKQLTSTVSGASQQFNFTYSYADAATNDFTHSAAATSVPTITALYNPPYSEFRGFAMVKETAPGGRVTTTYFHQDDALKGQPGKVLIGTQSFSDTFNTGEALNPFRWYFINGIPASGFARLGGDRTFKVQSQATTWNTSAQLSRTNYNLTTGNSVFVHFQISGDAPESIVGINTISGYRWAIWAHGNAITTNVKDQSGIWDNSHVILNNYDRDRWYVLQLTISNGKFLMRVWDRDNPDQSGSYECLTMPDGQLWRFLHFTRTTDASKPAVTYFDEYNEGVLYSENETTYLIDVDDVVLPSSQMKIYWTRPEIVTSRISEGESTWSGSRTVMAYDDHGNQTKALQEEWITSTLSWRGYRIILTDYYPNLAAGQNLIGLPGRVEQFKCPQNSYNRACLSANRVNSDKLSSTWYIYDDLSRSYTAIPTAGKLLGQRKLLYFANHNFTEPRYLDLTFEYDAWGNQKKVTQYRGEGTETVRATGGPVTSRTEFENTYHTYPWRILDAKNYTTTLEYDPNCGQPTREIDINNAEIDAEYDGLCRLTKVIRVPEDSSSDPGFLVIYHDPGANNPLFWTEVAQKIDGQAGLFYRLRKFYNGLGNLIQTQQVGATVNGSLRDIISDTGYNAFGQVIQQFVPYDIATGGSSYQPPTPNNPLYSTQTKYDPLGRITEVTPPDSAGKVTYKYSRLLVTASDARNNPTSTYTDVWGRTRLVVPAEGPGVAYSFNETDLLTATVRGGATTKIHYDLAGRKTWMDDDDMGEWTYTYDAIGSLVTQTDARECTTTLTYDDLNRVTAKNFSGTCSATTEVLYRFDDYSTANYPDLSDYPTSQPTINGIGRRTGMVDASGHTIWTYDALGRMTREQKVVTGASTYVTTWEYYSDDQVKAMTYPTGERVAYGYDAQKAVKSLASTGQVYLQNQTYDAAGRVLQGAYGAGLFQTVKQYYGWTEQGGRLHTLQSGPTGAPTSLQDFHYNYDPNGNLLQILEIMASQAQTQTFTYDEVNRLTSAQAQGGTSGAYGSEVYSYAAGSGNLASKAGVSYTYGDTNHKHAVTALSNGWAYQYDANGNMTHRSAGSVLDLAYDGENHLIQASGPVTSTFSYDGDGNRISASDADGLTVYIGNYFEQSLTTHYSGTTYNPPGGMRVGFSGRISLNSGMGISGLAVRLQRSVTCEVDGDLYAHSALPDSGWTGSTAELKIYRYSGEFEKSLYGDTHYPDFSVSDSLSPMSYQAYLMVLNPDDRVLYSEVLPFAMNSGVDTHIALTLTRTTPPAVGPVTPLPYTKHGDETLSPEDYDTTDVTGSYYLEGGKFVCTCSCRYKIDYTLPPEYSAVSASAPNPGEVVNATTIAYRLDDLEAGALYPENHFLVQGPATPIPGITINRSYYYASGQRIAMRVEGEYDPSRDGVYFLLGDHLGSTHVTVKATDLAKKSVLRYKPWGETRYSSGVTPTTFHYTGQREDSYINIYWFNSRWYDSALGRFTQPDSIIPASTQGTQAWDRYAYVNNNPIKYDDPTGHCVLLCIVAAVIIVVMAAAATPFVEHQVDEFRKPVIDNYPHGMGCTDSLSSCYSQGKISPLIEPISKPEFDEFLETLAGDFKKGQAPSGVLGFISERQTFDTPFYDGGGRGSSNDDNKYLNNVCIQTVGCYPRSAVNYLAQGMWSAEAGDSLSDAYLATNGWQWSSYTGDTPSDKLYWTQYGYLWYQNWLEWGDDWRKHWKPPAPPSSSAPPAQSTPPHNV